MKTLYYYIYYYSIIYKSIACFFFYFIQSYCGVVAQNLNSGFQWDTKSPEKIVIDCKIVNNLMIVPVIINDFDTLNFIVDSGVGNIIITDTERAKKLQFSSNGRVNVRGSGQGGNLTAIISSNNKVQLGELIGKNMKILILSEDLFQLTSYMGFPVHGLLGYDLFAKSVVEFNYSKSKMVLYDPERFIMKKQFHIIPLIVNNSKPYTQVTVVLNNEKKKESLLLIDTGASHAFSLFNDTIFQMFAGKATKKTHLGNGFGGEIFGSNMRIDNVQIGKYYLKNPIASFPDANSINLNLFLNSNGSIGCDVWKRFDLVFDYSRNQLGIKKNNNYFSEYNHNIAGLNVIAFGEHLNQYKILYVGAGSPAARAGLQIDDIIITIDGKPVSTLKLQEINTLLQKKKKNIGLIIQRNGMLMSINLTYEKADWL